ncbi:MAG TPA: LUD domain-containing protein [Verrucomicrobiae bacterium]|jgi:L-lactate dehydrogenase complex protein LldG|nr:LUD domain-containing protein [Verrucomicrobiae bacterium]
MNTIAAGNSANNILTSQEIILARIQEALRIPAAHAAGKAPDGRGLASVPDSLDAQIQMFAQNAESLRAEFVVCGSLDEAVARAESYGWKKIAWHKGELTGAVAARLPAAQLETDGGYAVEDLESCDAAMTECESLVAQTGSVLVSSAAAGGRALSVLPPHHLVLARRSQMVANLSAALQRVRNKYHNEWPSFLSFITGPSRTGDIERILVLGAHGPRKLTILLLP